MQLLGSFFRTARYPFVWAIVFMIDKWFYSLRSCKGRIKDDILAVRVDSRRDIYFLCFLLYVTKSGLIDNLLFNIIKYLYLLK